MARIGRVSRRTYKDVDKKDVPYLSLEIRTITMKKDFTISVNKMKWESGKVGEGTPVQGKEDHADFHIWAMVNKRGEAIPGERVGSIKDVVKQETGLEYKKASIFDPFIQKEAIYFTLFKTDDDKKLDEDHLYDAIAQPYRKTYTQNNDQDQRAQPNYEPSSPAGGSIPEYDIDEDEIPF